MRLPLKSIPAVLHSIEISSMMVHIQFIVIQTNCTTHPWNQHIKSVYVQKCQWQSLSNVSLHPSIINVWSVNNLFVRYRTANQRN